MCQATQYSMGIAALIIGSSPQRLWGITSSERIKRQLRAADIDPVLADSNDLADREHVLLINANYLFEVRTLTGLLQQAPRLLECPDDGAIAAAHVKGTQAAALIDVVAHTETARPEDITVIRPQLIEGFDGDLRKVEPPVLKPITADNRIALENRLYGNSYKGITDLVTKWMWPKPAKHLVRLCTQTRISPNMVTIAGLLLVIAASFLFLYGHYALGLACGWVMTLLDTVDGKLARVTVQSSRFGHVLDHGMDIIHPPFWYVMWGMGLVSFEPLLGLERPELYWAIIGGYIAGRVIEGMFHGLGRCSMFVWRPLDAYFRLVTARRNPCLIILTGAVVVGRADWGLIGVAMWTAISSAIMLMRLFYAAGVRLTNGPLESWLKDPAAAQARYAAAYRTFSGTRSAYG